MIDLPPTPPPPAADRLDTSIVLRAHGLRERIHPHDACAWLHQDEAHVRASNERDRALGNDIHGPWHTEAGWVWVTDMRPQLRAKGYPVTDPGLPDDVLKVRKRERRGRRRR